MTTKAKGTIVTLVSGIAWGLSGVSGQFLMQNGLDAGQLTTIRLFLSGVFLIAIVWCRDAKRIRNFFKDRNAILTIVLFSIIGLALNQFAYLKAIDYTNAGTATVLQYLCPMLVLSYVCAKERKLPTVLEVLAIILAIIGTFLIATHGRIDKLAITPAGLAWGLLSALAYAFYIILPIKVIRKYGSLMVLGIAMLFGSFEIGLVLQPWKQTFYFNTGIFFGFIGLVGVGTMFAYTAFLYGVSVVGQVNGSLLASIEPIASVLLAVVLLNERFYMIDSIGMVFIISAVLLISAKDVIAAHKKRPAY